MKKLKTHKGTAKRIWRTASGKLMRRHANRSHHQNQKTSRQLQGRGGSESVPQSNPRVGELLPY